MLKSVLLVFSAVPTIGASVAGSLFAVWGISKLADLHFHPSLVIVLSAAIAAVAIGSNRRRRL